MASILLDLALGRAEQIGSSHPKHGFQAMSTSSFHRQELSTTSKGAKSRQWTFATWQQRILNSPSWRSQYPSTGEKARIISILRDRPERFIGLPLEVKESLLTSLSAPLVPFSACPVSHLRQQSFTKLASHSVY